MLSHQLKYPNTFNKSVFKLFFQISFEALHLILAPEPPTDQPAAPLLDDLLLSEAFLHADDQEHWLRLQLKVSDDIIKTTVEKTKGQRTNAIWAAVRKLRITASSFGQVIRAVRLKRYYSGICIVHLVSHQRYNMFYSKFNVSSAIWQCKLRDRFIYFISQDE